MKTPIMLRSQLGRLVTIAALAVVLSTPGVTSAAAQTASTPSTNAPAATAPATTNPASAANPAPAGKSADSKAITAPSSSPAESAPAPVFGPAVTPPTQAVTVTNGDLDRLVPEYTNWVTVGVGSAFVNGNSGEYGHRENTGNGPFGGIDDFHLQQFVGKNGVFNIDGHAIFGNHDYDVKLDYTDSTIGYVRAGYTDYRVWYDSTGGFFQPFDLSFEPYSNDLYIDRRTAWFEAGLTLPDLPVFAFRYEYDSREGQMDSTSWGTTTLTGGLGNRNIVPSFLGIDETQNIFSFDVSDKIDNTTADLGLRYQIDRTDDSSYLEQNPGQASQRFVTQQELEKDDSFVLHGSQETEFDKSVTFSSGFSVTKMDSDLDGGRVYGAAYNAPFNPTYPGRQRFDEAFLNLGGGGNTSDYAGNLNAMWIPVQNLSITPAFRVEYLDSDMGDNFDGTNVTATAAPVTVTPEAAQANDWNLDLAQSIEARYTGFRDWSLYANAEVSEEWGNDSWDSNPLLDNVNFNQDWERLHQKYTFGANWYPLAGLNFAAQYYHEISEYDYSDVNNPSSPPQYPGYLRKQNFTTDDMNIRATWQALPSLSFVTRYDLQFSTVDTWAVPNAGTEVGGVESATLINHIISEDATWSPIPCLYLQGGASYVLNTLETPVAGSSGINNLVLNGSNNYWTVNASAGYDFNAKTHLQLQYTYYNAYNYTDNSQYSLPYGASDVENSLLATITRDVSKNVKVSVKYGFYRGRDLTSGGQSNYDAQLVYVSTQFGF